ncbi:DUF397 domain-containing protein [Streptomyces sp. NPDC059850]|uniref:DUF397 domain-containing protein n=1 Tax=Streptomyces sp. NPDC059850 TaxID=3346970 RepID=UPI00365E227E
MSRELHWFKSSYSGAQGEACIEVAACPDAVHVRDSKDTALPALTVTAPAWASFVGFAARMSVAPSKV